MGNSVPGSKLVDSDQTGNKVSLHPRLGHESVLVGNKLLMWGGMGRVSGKWRCFSRREVFSLDVHSQQWNHKMAAIATEGDEPTPCFYAQCCVIDNIIYSFGGRYYTDDGRIVRLNEMLSLDYENMTWKKLEVRGNKPPGRSSCGFCAVGEKLVIHGGKISVTDKEKLPAGVQYKKDDSKCGSVNDCWQFCPHEVSWLPVETCGQSPTPRHGHSFTAITIGRIVLYGGYNGKWLNDMHVLDCRDRVWTWSKVMHSVVWPGRRAFHTTCHVSDSFCVVMGGWLEGCAAGDAYVVDIKRGSAHHITLNDARAFHTACCRVASDGSALIFVLGGTRNDYFVRSVIFDLCVYSWGPRAPTALSNSPDFAAQLQRQLDAERREQEDARAPLALSFAGENEGGRELASRLHGVGIGKGTADEEKEETIDELAAHNTQLAGENEELRRRLREIAAEKEELIGQLTAAGREKEELINELAFSNAENERIAQQYETLKAEKEVMTGENENLTQDVSHLVGCEALFRHQEGHIQQEAGLRLDEAARQVIEGSRRLHQLRNSIHSEESRQLIDEDQESRYLRQTRLHDFHINSYLGESTTNKIGRYGCNSIVYRVETRNISGANYVMKAMFNPHDASGCRVMSDAQIENLFRAEYDLPCRPHSNVLRVLHHFCATVPPQGLPNWPPEGGHSSMFLIMEEYDCNLQRHCRQLHANGKMNERVLLMVAVQLFSGVEHLVKHNILHRDLKLDNIVLKVKENMTRTVICDFGCSYEASQSLSRVNAKALYDSASGNPSHHSPELSSLSLNPAVVCDVSKADVWAVGLMAYEMVTRRGADDILSHEQKQMHYTADILPPIQGIYSIHCQHLLQHLVSYNVEDRPSACEAIQLCCIVLYGPAIPSEGEMRVGDAQLWLDQQVVSLRGRRDDELLQQPFYIKYLDLFSPHEVTRLVNTFLIR